MTDWADELSALTRALGSGVRGAARQLARAVGDTSPYEIAAYRGHGSAERLFVHGRVLEQEQIGPAGAADSTWRNIMNTMKRLGSDPLPHARVRVHQGGARHEIIADDEGFFGGWIPLSGTLPADTLWHP